MTITGKETYFLQPEFPVEIYIPIDIDLYKEAVKSPSRKWRVTVEVDFPAGTVTFTEDDILYMSLLKESSSRGDNPLGFVSSNEFTIVLDNSERKFTPTDSNYEHEIRPGLEVRPYLTLELPNVPHARIPLGTYWSGDWDTRSDTVEARTTCHDRMAQIIHLDTPQIPVMVDVSIGEMFGRLFRAIGLEQDEYEISPALSQTVRVGWFPRQSVGQSLKLLSEAGNCFTTVEQNKIIVKPNMTTGDAVDDYTSDDMIFVFNNPQRVNDIFTTVRVEYRLPYLKEPNIDLVRADRVLIEPGVNQLDRIDFLRDDIPIMQVNWVHLFGEENKQETFDLFLGDANGGTFKLSDGTTDTGDINYNCTDDDIVTELEVLYGAGNVTVTGADGEFTIAFNLSVEQSGLTADFDGLTNATDPALLTTQEYKGQLGSKVTDTAYGATDISLEIENIHAEDEEVDIQVKGVGTGHHPAHRLAVNQEAVDSYGRRELHIENPLVQQGQTAQSHGDKLLAYVSDPLSHVEASWRGDPVREIGDIVTLDGLKVVIHRLYLEYDGGLRAQLDGRRVAV